MARTRFDALFGPPCDSIIKDDSQPKAHVYWPTFTAAAEAVDVKGGGRVAPHSTAARILIWLSGAASQRSARYCLLTDTETCTHYSRGTCVLLFVNSLRVWATALVRAAL